MTGILLLNGNRNNWEQRLIQKTAEEDGWTTYKVYGYPQNQQSKDKFPAGPYAVYGTVEWTDSMAEHLGFKLVDAPLDFLPKLPIQLAGRIVTLGRAYDAKGGRKFRQHPFFIKPARNKTFEAKIYETASVPDYVDDDEIVLFQDSIHFDLEFRTFWLNGKMVASSPYMKNMKPIELKEPEDSYWDGLEHLKQSVNVFCTILSRYLPKDWTRSIVIDIGLLTYEEYMDDFGDWVVVEANNPHSSGLYDCDPKAVWECLKQCVVS